MTKAKDLTPSIGRGGYRSGFRVFGLPPLAASYLVIGVLACSKGSEPPAELASARPATATDACNDEPGCLRACDAGNNTACDTLTSIYLKENRRDDATRLVKRLCEGKRRYFCPSFAFSLALGEGIAADRARARQLFEDTCPDDPRGCSEFGNLFMAGRGVPLDVELGSLLLDLACKHRDQDACRELAQFRAATGQ